MIKFFRAVPLYFLKRSHQYKYSKLSIALFMDSCGSTDPKNYEFAFRKDGINVEHCPSRVDDKEGWNITIRWDGTTKYINPPPHRDVNKPV